YMLTWFIVISFSCISLAMYMYVLLQGNDYDLNILMERIAEKERQNRDYNAEVSSLNEKIIRYRAYLKRLIVQAKSYRKEKNDIEEELPELKKLKEKWENFELTEEKALAEYKKWKKESV